jgi:hypothetical protein
MIAEPARALAAQAPAGFPPHRAGFLARRQDRTAGGRRAQIAVGTEPVVIEAEVGLENGPSVGERVGLEVRIGRVFPD